MLYLVLIFLIFLTGGIVLQKIKTAMSYQKHLEDWQLHQFWNGSLRKDKKAYDQVINHLGSCDACQKRLQEYEKGKDIEKHLINRKKNE